MTRPDSRILEHLPAPTTKLLILHFALDGASGFQLMKRCNDAIADIGHSSRLAQSNFSTSLKLYAEQGLLEVEDLDDPKKSKLRKTTDLGRAVLVAQIERNNRLLAVLDEGLAIYSQKEV